MHYHYVRQALFTHQSLTHVLLAVMRFCYKAQAIRGAISRQQMCLLVSTYSTLALAVDINYLHIKLLIH